MESTDLAHLTRAVELAELARAHGNHPFGALLVTATGEIVEAENTVVIDGDPTGHAETNLVRKASAVLDRTALATATLYTSTEPCAMCCGAVVWSGVRSVVIAGSGPDLELITGFDEGPIHPDWAGELTRRGIHVTDGVLRDESLQMFRDFARSGRPVYNARRG